MVFFVRRNLERLLHNLGIEVKKASVLIISPVTRRVLVAKGSPVLSNTNSGLILDVLFMFCLSWGGGYELKNSESFPSLQKHTRAGMVLGAMKVNLNIYNASTSASVIQLKGRVHGKEIDQNNICSPCFADVSSTRHVLR